ncbi:MAG: hypothetical protein ACFFDW_14090 [Candidatus Thorarchaeota archaeon]
MENDDWYIPFYVHEEFDLLIIIDNKLVENRNEHWWPRGHSYPYRTYNSLLALYNNPTTRKAIPKEFERFLENKEPIIRSLDWDIQPSHETRKKGIKIPYCYKCFTGKVEDAYLTEFCLDFDMKINEGEEKPVTLSQFRFYKEEFDNQLPIFDDEKDYVEKSEWGITKYRKDLAKRKLDLSGKEAFLIFGNTFFKNCSSVFYDWLASEEFYKMMKESLQEKIYPSYEKVQFLMEFKDLTTEKEVLCNYLKESEK